MKVAAMSTTWALVALAGAMSLADRPAQGCVGAECMNVWSTAAGGGGLTMEWDTTRRKVQTHLSLCAGGQCLYSSIDPGFRAPEASAAPAGYYALAEGTTIGIELVAIDPGVTVRIDGVPLKQPGTAAVLGTVPNVHTHPSWQLSLPEGVRGDFNLSFRLSGPPYATSETLTVRISNLATPTPEAPPATATPTATPTREVRCAGDCNGDDTVSMDELITGVGGALGGTGCAAFDGDGNRMITVDELVAAVGAALSGCPLRPTPTATREVSLAAIQAEIFAPRCAIPTCHDAASAAGGLVLDAAGAFAELVGVAPTIDTARDAGLLRVDDGDPTNSFLLVKLDGPPPDQGSRMPLAGLPLDPAEIQRIRDWIATGAQP